MQRAVAAKTKGDVPNPETNLTSVSKAAASQECKYAFPSMGLDVSLSIHLMILKKNDVKTLRLGPGTRSSGADG